MIREYQGKRYTYDAQGNVIETTQGNKTLKLTWDNLNRLIQSDHNGRITQYVMTYLADACIKNHKMPKADRP